MSFLANAFPVLWVLVVVVILRSFRSASCHDEEFESSGGEAAEPTVDADRHGTWHRCPHDIVSGGRAA
jgi:hypothetical protein